MTWETESLSDAPSGIHSNMDSDVLWSDDPELAYFRSLMNEQKDGASTMAGILDEQTLQTNEAPGASSGLTVAEDDTIARIDADDGTAKNWFAKQRSKPTHNIKMNTDDENKSNPYILAMQVITPVSAVSPHDRAANGRPNRPIMPNNYVRHNDNVVADSDADDNMTIPSTIFVTGGHPSAIQTKNGKGRSKRAGNKTPVKGKEKPSLHVDTSPRNTRTGPRSIFFWGKVFFVILLLAVLVAIIMLAIVFVQRGQDDGANSSQEGSFADDITFPPAFRLATGPSAAPTQLKGLPANTPTLDPNLTSKLDTKSPTTGPTRSPTNPIGQPTDSPTKQPTSNPTQAPLFVDAAAQDMVNKILDRSPESIDALSDSNSPQSRAIYWLLDDPNVSSYLGNRLLQRWALATLYFSTGGNNWIDSSSWMSGANECGWSSIACRTDNSVNSIRLRGNNLEGGPLPAEFFLFLSDAMVNLHLDGNSITGSLPTTLGLLTGLQRLQLTSNELSGTIPTQLGELKGVGLLALGRNKLNGQLPSELGLLEGLKTLDVTNNEITGTIPTEYGQMWNLENILLRGNKITGAVPSELGQLSFVQKLTFDRTDLSGEMPAAVCGLNAIELKADCEEITCSCCTECCVDGGGCISETVSPTQFTTLSPTTAQITLFPTTAPVPGSTFAPTDQASSFPTKQPTGSPSSSSSSAPTLRKTNAPTKAVTAEPASSFPTKQATGSPSSSSSSVPTLRKTNAPTKAVTAEPSTGATQNQTSRPSRSPTSTPTKAPTGLPVTTNPTKAPTRLPAPVPKPTQSPTRSQLFPTISPTISPTACSANITTDKICYVTGENIVVSFNNCNPEPDDWIGVYAADADPNDLGDPLVWLWACGNQDCEESVLQGNATFFEARGSGAFKVFMVRRNSGGIYKAYGIGDQFWLATTCDWRRELTNSESQHSLSAVFK